MHQSINILDPHRDNTNLKIYPKYPEDSDAEHDKDCDANEIREKDAFSIRFHEDEKSVNFYVVTKPKSDFLEREKHKKCLKNIKSEDISVRTKRQTEEPERLMCFLCPFETNMPRRLSKHLHSEHKGDNNKCELKLCPFKQMSNSYLFKHAEFHRSGNHTDTFYCLKCTFGTKFPKKFAKHTLTNCKFGTSEKQELIHCPLCTFTKKSRLAVLIHFKTHGILNTSNILECPLCRMKVKKTRFAHHARYHI